MRRLEGHARARQVGREAAAAHLARGTYLPRPEVVAQVDRRLAEDGQQRITGPDVQDRARARTAELLARQAWRPERVESSSVMLEAMVARMDRETGLITIVRSELAAAADRSERTVTALWAWAQRSGLFTQVESGASKEALGADRNRAATFAFTEDTPTPEDDHFHPPGVSVTRSLSPQREDEKQPRRQEVPPVDESPEGRRLRRDRLVNAGQWPTRDVPTTGLERRAAADRFLDEFFLTGSERRRLHRALLRGGLWDADTACPATLSWAVRHHPDDPGHDLGDPLRGARDRVRCLLGRLSPWRGRLDEGLVPDRFRGVDRAARVAVAAARGHAPDPARPEFRPTASSSVRSDRMAEIRTVLAARKAG